jgi:hypothetical protein
VSVADPAVSVISTRRQHTVAEVRSGRFALSEAIALPPVSTLDMLRDSFKLFREARSSFVFDISVREAGTGRASEAWMLNVGLKVQANRRGGDGWWRLLGWVRK